MENNQDRASEEKKHRTHNSPIPMNAKNGTLFATRKFPRLDLSVYVLARARSTV